METRTTQMTNGVDSAQLQETVEAVQANPAPISLEIRTKPQERSVAR